MMDSFIVWSRQNGLFIVTAILILIAEYVFFWYPLEEAARIGELLAGFSAALAFLWLIAGYKQQSIELSLQRQSLQTQAEELKSMRQFSAFDQISKIIETGLSNIKYPDPSITEPGGLGTCFLPNQDWKILLESLNTAEIIAAYRRWLPIETAVRMFINTISAASRIYFKNNDIKYSEYSSEFTFIYVNSSLLYKVPYISNYIGVAGLLSKIGSSIEPGLEVMQLAFFTAQAITLNREGSEIIKRDELKKLHDKLAAENRLPEISKKYKY